MPSNSTFLEVKNAFQAIAGLESLTSADEFFLQSSTNRAVTRAYDESDAWPRYLVVGESRTVSSSPAQTIPYVEGGKEEIGQFLRIHRTQPMLQNSALEFDFYVDSNGAHILNPSTGESNVAYVTYKKALSTNYTPDSTDIPSEFVDYIIYTALSDFYTGDGQIEQSVFASQKADLIMDRQPLTDRLGDRLLAEYGGAAAAYSLRALNGNGDSVVRVRRASDNDEKDFTAEQIELGEMVNWVNSQIVPPLDIGVLTPEGRIPVPEGGTSIGIPAAAYSLRNLSTTYTGNVVDVRRSSGGTESFTAAEVSDGTLEAWVSEDTTQYMQFDGVDDFVQSTTVPDIASSTVTITLEYTANEAQFIELQSAGAFHLVGTLNSTVGGSNDLVVGSHNSNTPSSGAKFRYNGLTVGDVITIVLNIDATYQITSATVNGASMTTAGSGASRQETSSKTTLRLGRRSYDAGIAYAGYFTNFSVSTDSTYDWDGTEAGAISNGWTVNGSPTSTLLNDGFVTQWYDQSGNDNHATQGTAASQPKIVDAGVLVSGR
jgi:hypothetical protein